MSAPQRAARALLATARVSAPRRAACALLAAALALPVATGCGDDREPADRAEPSPMPAATAATPAAVRGERVRFRAGDGRPVMGTLTRAGRPAPALVLVHQLGGGADQWDEFVPYLHQAGFSTLAYDGRGGRDERGLVSEAEGAVAFLARRNDVDRDRLGVVGASIGANTAALVLARDRGRLLCAGVALSPGDPSIVHRLQAAGRYHPRNLLIVADPEEFPAARRFARGAVASRALRSPDYGHGVNLLGHDDDRAQVMRWLIDHVR